MSLKERLRIIPPTHRPELCMIRRTITRNRVLKFGCVVEIYPFVKKPIRFCRGNDLRVESFGSALDYGVVFRAIPGARYKTEYQGAFGWVQTERVPAKGCCFGGDCWRDRLYS